MKKEIRQDRKEQPKVMSAYVSRCQAGGGKGGKKGNGSQRG